MSKKEIEANFGYGAISWEFSSEEFAFGEELIGKFNGGSIDGPEGGPHPWDRVSFPGG